MAKITFLGAGSTIFAKNVLGDTMLSPALHDVEIALYDIDAGRLEDSYLMLSSINNNCNQGRAVIKTYLGTENRREALRGAKYVVNAVQIGGYDPCTIIDFEVPKNMAFGRPLEIPWEFPEFSAPFAPFRYCSMSQKRWSRYVRMHGSSTIQILWELLPAPFSAISPSKP